MNTKTTTEGHLPWMGALKLLLGITVLIGTIHLFHDVSSSAEDTSKNKNGPQLSSTINYINPQPKIHLLTYGTDDQYASSKQRLVHEGLATGWFDTVKAFGPQDLPKRFKKKFKKVLRQDRGGGYWVWKLGLFQHYLETIPQGDFFVYLDAGCKVNAKGKERFYEYIQMIQDANYHANETSYDMIGFHLPTKFQEHEWTTHKIFQAFQIDDNNSDLRNSAQLVGGIQVIRNGPHARQWIQEVARVLEKDPWLITDKYNDKAHKADPEFEDNRHDQSIFSVSRKKMGCILLPDETFPHTFPDPNREYPFLALRLQTGIEGAD